MNSFRSQNCAELNINHVGQQVSLCGWVHRVRDHGGVLFIDLRDHYGITQILADPDSIAFAEIEKVRSEWCIGIVGEVKAREKTLINENIATGHIEVFINELKENNLYDKIWQAYAALLPHKTVGVMGDSRTYEYTCLLRAVKSEDGMTAEYFNFPNSFIENLSNKIINKVPGVNRVVYDVSSKPPSTIELE